MQKGLVSVVIPSYNYAHFLRETIDCVLAQTYSDIEVIVVDDGSTDATKEILEGYGEQIQSIFQQNQGVSVARNNGARSSRGEFVAFLDADDIWMPTKIEKQILQFKQDEKLGLVHVGVEEVDVEGNSLLKRLEGLEGDVSKDFLMLKGVLGGGSGLMVPRRIFEEIGGFDTRLSTSADWDMFYQISCRYSVGFVPEILLKYRIHDSNMHANVRVMEHDMKIAFEKAFQDGSTDVQRLRREAYGNLFSVLAGSYFYSGELGKSVISGFNALIYYPTTIKRFLGFPFRVTRRILRDRHSN